MRVSLLWTKTVIAASICVRPLAALSFSVSARCHVNIVFVFCFGLFFSLWRDAGGETQRSYQNNPRGGGGVKVVQLCT